MKITFGQTESGSTQTVLDESGNNTDTVTEFVVAAFSHFCTRDCLKLSRRYCRLA